VAENLAEDLETESACRIRAPERALPNLINDASTHRGSNVATHGAPGPESSGASNLGEGPNDPSLPFAFASRLLERAEQLRRVGQKPERGFCPFVLFPASVCQDVLQIADSKWR